MAKAKTKTITVSSGWGCDTTTGKPDSYRVERVTDSVEYTPGQILHVNEVSQLCALSWWKVTIVPFKPGVQA